MTALLISSFYALTWVFPGDSLFPLVQWWCHHYVIPLPAEAPTFSGWAIQSGAFPPWHIFHACAISFGKRYSQLHSSSSFWRIHISCSQHTSTHNTSHTWTHAFKVSVCLWCSASTLLTFHHTMHPLTCVYSTNLDFLLRWWTGHSKMHS